MRKVFAVTAILLFVFADAYATCGGGGGGGMGGINRGGFGPMNTPTPEQQPKPYIVPWRVLKTGDAPLTSPIIVYWFPATPDEMNRSELVQSRNLVLYSAQCIGMQLVKPEDNDTATKWNVTADKRPIAILVSDGKEVARVNSDHGSLPSSQIENAIHH